MVKIAKIPRNAEERLAKGLNYAVKKRSGYSKHLQAKCGKDTFQYLQTSGAINTGMKKDGKETFKITNSGNQFYKNMYGTTEYYKTRIRGIFEKIMGKI